MGKVFHVYVLDNAYSLSSLNTITIVTSIFLLNSNRLYSVISIRPQREKCSIFRLGLVLFHSLCVRSRFNGHRRTLD
jgi:hypothetical protein